MLQQQLDIETLLLINTPGGKAEVIMHVDKILEECNKYDFLKMLNMGEERSLGEQKLLLFQDAVRRKEPELMEKVL